MNTANSVDVKASIKWIKLHNWGCNAYYSKGKYYIFSIDDPFKPKGKWITFRSFRAVMIWAGY